MTWLRCTGCDEVVEVPDELVGDAEVSAEGEILNDGSWFYLCDSCDMKQHDEDKNG